MSVHLFLLFFPFDMLQCTYSISFVIYFLKNRCVSCTLRYIHGIYFYSRVLSNIKSTSAL